MATEFGGPIAHDVRDSQSDWTPYLEPQAPDGAPNVLFIVWDDMGFGGWDLYGGLIRMPNMAELQALWDQQAQRYDGYPLDDRGVTELVLVKHPTVGRPRSAMTLYPDSAPVPERSGVQIVGRSFTVVADLETGDSAAEGVIYSMGARFGGHALFLQEGRLTYVYNWLGESEQTIVSDRELPPGRTLVGVRYVIEGHDGQVPHGTATLLIGDVEVGTAAIRTQPAYFTLSGEGATVGREIGQSVSTRYQPPFAFTGGTIHSVLVDVADEDYSHAERLVQGALSRD